MAKREIKVTFFFTSTKADGADYSVDISIKAENETAALNVGRIVGFEYFGARFTENCYDWRIAK